MCAGVCPRDRRRRRRGVFASRRDREHPELWHGLHWLRRRRGGGAGEYYEGELAVAPGIPLAITIGAGGGPGSSTTDGTAGGQTLIQQGASVLKSLSGGGGGGRASYTFGGVSGRAADSRAAPARRFAGLSGYASPPGNGGGGGFRHSARGPGGHRSGSLNYAGGAGYPPHSRAWGAVEEAVVRWAPPMAITRLARWDARRRHIGIE